MSLANQIILGLLIYRMANENKYTPPFESIFFDGLMIL
jgi:hypothetical protein